MTPKELKRLGRAELLELLLEQSREVERLRKRVNKLEALLEERQLQVTQAGDLAQATLAVNGVMEAAQNAAKQYLDNIAAMEAETKARCEAMLAQARQDSGLSPEQKPELNLEDVVSLYENIY